MSTGIAEEFGSEADRLFAEMEALEPVDSEQLRREADEKRRFRLLLAVVAACLLVSAADAALLAMILWRL